MPGSSLWLVPPSSHPLHSILTTLITSSLPALFPANITPPLPAFAPHLTLTSNIDPSIYGSDPQGWLDSLPLPTAVASVVFERVITQDFFYRRCYLKVGYEGVCRVAAVARARGVEGEEGDEGEEGEEGSGGERTEKWLGQWREAFGPHVSLVYGDMPIDEAKSREIEKAVREAGIALVGGTNVKGEEGIAGWEGGTVWLVPTDRRIEDWTPIATRAI
ncbi:unnamed protein product [Discula destructiva]